ncbi:hypothetical protein QTP88_000713 [Uroleucon formosanum]
MDKANNSPVSTPTILTDIIQARTNIKQKYNALKTGRFETDALINNTFSSIIGPLNEIKSDNKRKPFHRASPPPSESVTPDVDSTVNGSLPHLHSTPATYKDLNARFGPWTKPVYRVTMDAFGGPPDSRLNKSIADMEEKFENELVTHVNLIEINDAKITALSGEFTKELAIISDITVSDGKKISTLSDENQVNKMKIMHLESTLLASIDKYFSENNNRIESLIESVDIASKNIQDLKINLTYANTRIVMLEDRVDGYQYSLKTITHLCVLGPNSKYLIKEMSVVDVDGWASQHWIFKHTRTHENTSKVNATNMWLFRNYHQLSSPGEYRKPFDWRAPKGRVIPRTDNEKRQQEFWPSGVLRSNRHREHTDNQCIPPESH